MISRTLLLQEHHLHLLSKVHVARYQQNQDSNHQPCQLIHWCLDIHVKIKDVSVFLIIVKFTVSHKEKQTFPPAAWTSFIHSPNRSSWSQLELSLGQWRSCLHVFGLCRDNMHRGEICTADLQLCSTFLTEMILLFSSCNVSLIVTLTCGVSVWQISPMKADECTDICCIKMINIESLSHTCDWRRRRDSFSLFSPAELNWNFLAAACTTYWLLEAWRGLCRAEGPAPPAGSEVASSSPSGILLCSWKCSH